MKQITVPRVRDFVRMNAIFIVLLALVISIAIIDPRFLSIRPLRDILLQSATRAIIALGIFFIILTGGVDLSAGRMVGLAAVVSASMLQSPTYLRRFYPDLPQLPLWLPILIAIAICFIAGICNGWIVARFGVPPFIATLGMQVAIYGINSIYFDLPPNNSQPIGGLSRAFTNLGTGTIGEGLYSLPYIVIIAAVVAVFAWIIANKTQFGKNVTRSRQRVGTGFWCQHREEPDHHLRHGWCPLRLSGRLGSSQNRRCHQQLWNNVRAGRHRSLRRGRRLRNRRYR